MGLAWVLCHVINIYVIIFTIIRCLVWFVSNCSDNYSSWLISTVYSFAMQALSRLAIQTLEFILTLLLLKLTAKPNYRFRYFFRDNELCNKRNWIFASAFGVGFLFSLVFLTSLLAESVIGPKVSMMTFCLRPTFAFPIEFSKIASYRLVIALFGLYQKCKVYRTTR